MVESVSNVVTGQIMDAKEMAIHSKSLYAEKVLELAESVKKINDLEESCRSLQKLADSKQEVVNHLTLELEKAKEGPNKSKRSLSNASSNRSVEHSGVKHVPEKRRQRSKSRSASRSQSKDTVWKRRQRSKSLTGSRSQSTKHTGVKHVSILNRSREEKRRQRSRSASRSRSPPPRRRSRSRSTSRRNASRGRSFKRLVLHYFSNFLVFMNSFVGARATRS